MFQSLDEEINSQVQRFNTPVIRDFDFPMESGNQPMPGQQTEFVAAPEPESPPITAEQAAEQQIHEAFPVVKEPEPIPHTVVTPTESAPLPLEPPAAENEQVRHLDPQNIPKFMNQLQKPPVYCAVPSDDESRLFTVDICEFKQQILPPGFPETKVWGYGGNVMDEETCRIRYYKNAPGATFEAVRNIPIKVKWTKKLNGSHLFTSDPNPAYNAVPTDAHPRSGKASSVLSGQPDAWLTSDANPEPAYGTTVSTYSNNQEAATLWYQGHAPGSTRHNIYAGLAGFYLLRSGKEFGWRRDSILPTGRYEVPLIIQDRSFNTDGSLSVSSGLLGDTITVNGKVWPNLTIERRQYRFRLLNGSDTRIYHLSLSNGMMLTKIGSDSGFLPEPVELDSLRLAPSERADILVDFSGVMPGTKIILLNDARAPFPEGSTPDPDTTGQILQLTVPADSPKPVKPKKLPSKLTV